MMPSSDKPTGQIVRSGQIQSERSFPMRSLGARNANGESPQASDRDSFEAGYLQGLARGRAQALAQLEQQEQARSARLGQSLEQHIDALATSIRAEFAAAEQHLAQQLTDLALGVAKRVLAHQLLVEPATVVSVVQEILNDIAPHPLPGQLIVNPQDAELIRLHCAALLERHHLDIVPDSKVLPGGCRIQHACLDIDSTIETRWDRATLSLRAQD
jgi:flagellar assembly protein FliH